MRSLPGTTPGKSNARRTRILAPAALAVALLAGVAGPAEAGTKTFIALLNAGQESPPTTSNGLGVAYLSLDTKTKMLCFALTYVGLTDAETESHFHGPAVTGENAPAVLGISPAVSPVGSPKTGCVGPLTKKQKKDLLRGLFYINVHTANNLPGEIRGQVLGVKGPSKKKPAPAGNGSGGSGGGGGSY